VNPTEYPIFRLEMSEEMDRLSEDSECDLGDFDTTVQLKVKESRGSDNTR